MGKRTPHLRKQSANSAHAITEGEIVMDNEEVSTEGWTRDTLLDVVKSSMRSTDFSAEYIVDAIISISHPDGFARLKEQSANSAHTITEEELDKMAEEYSKEILPNEKDGSQSRCGLEVGYIDGYKAARGVRPVSNEQIDELWQKYAPNRSVMSKPSFKAAIKQLNKKP